jgi:hypothetical protein
MQQTLLSKINEGDWILVPNEGEPVTFARPKDTDTQAHEVIAKHFEPDEWSGKVYTLTLDDGRKTEPRYGTAHVYLTEAPNVTHVEVDGVKVAEVRHVELEQPVEPGKPAGKGEVASTELVAALNAVLPLTLKDDTLPMLGAVKFESDGDELVLAATDRYVLGAYRVPWNGGHVDAVLRGDGAKELLTWARKAEKFLPITLTFGDRDVEASDYERKATFPLYDGEFVKWRAVLPDPDPSDLAFGVNKDYIGRFAKAGEKGEPMRITFRSPTKLLGIQIGERFTGAIMPVRLPDQPTERYATGDGVKHTTQEAAVDHANTVAATTGNIVAVESEPEPEPDLDTTDVVAPGKRVHKDADGTVRIEDWQGGDTELVTHTGRHVHITDDGVVTVAEPEPEPIPTTARVESSSGGRCGQCKGFGVVRKRGENKGGWYKTLKGAQEATEKGNSMPCPVCHGAAQAA